MHTLPRPPQVGQGHQRLRREHYALSSQNRYILKLPRLIVVHKISWSSHRRVNTNERAIKESHAIIYKVNLKLSRKESLHLEGFDNSSIGGQMLTQLIQVRGVMRILLAQSKTIGNVQKENVRERDR